MKAYALTVLGIVLLILALVFIVILVAAFILRSRRNQIAKRARIKGTKEVIYGKKKPKKKETKSTLRKTKVDYHKDDINFRKHS